MMNGHNAFEQNWLAEFLDAPPLSISEDDQPPKGENLQHH